MTCLFVSGATPTLATHAGDPHLGVLMTPRGWHGRGWLESVVARGARWAADNDAFSSFDADRFARMLDRLHGVPNCVFVVAPDVWGDARATLCQFDHWRDRIAPYPIALAGQDGLEDLPVPWPQFDALFIGGSDRWRGSRAMRDLLSEAKARGKWVHLGRINIGSVQIARYLGADSFDGSGFSREPARIVRALALLKRKAIFA